jgi:glucokinase
MLVGLDIGGTKCLAVALGADGAVRASARMPTPRSEPELLDAIVELAAVIGDGAAVGVGVAGLVNRAGDLSASPNLIGIGAMPLGAALRERFDVPVIVDNDNTCGANAEWKLGAARDSSDALFVAFGTGIGGGVIAGGELQRGRFGYAGEFGHMVVDVNGPRCPCGQRGCWERYASGEGLAYFGERFIGAPTRGEEVAELALAGNDGAGKAVNEVARWAALGLVNLTNALDPEVIVIGGGLVEMGDQLLTPMREWYERLSFPGADRPLPPIRPATFGEQACGVGAALMAGVALADKPLS